VDDRVRICREACEPSNRGRFLEDQLLSPDDQKMFRGGIFFFEGGQKYLKGTKYRTLPFRTLRDRRYSCL
jgi:hypothetical protein